MSDLNGSSPSGGLSILTGKDVKVPYLYEALTEICDPDPKSKAKVRVWRAEPEFPEYMDEEVLLTFKMVNATGAGMPEIVKALSSLERVTRIEIVTPEGCGMTVHYKVESQERLIEDPSA